MYKLVNTLITPAAKNPSKVSDTVIIEGLSVIVICSPYERSRPASFSQTL